MSKRLKKSTIIDFNNCEHEVFMEKDEHRKRYFGKNLTALSQK